MTDGKDIINPQEIYEKGWRPDMPPEEFRAYFRALDSRAGRPPPRSGVEPTRAPARGAELDAPELDDALDDVLDAPGVSTEIDSAVSVPEPDEWLAPPGEPPLPEVITADRDGLDDVTSHAIAARLLERLDAEYAGVLLDSGSVCVYREPVWTRLPVAWLDAALSLYHHTESYQQTQGKDAGVPWFSTPATRGAAKGELMTLLSRRQGARDSPLSECAALAAFSDQTLVYDTRHRHVGVVDHGREHGATFSYPFEFINKTCEPTWLLRILREDVFRGLDETERELRIERIRQQFGLALLGCQGLSNQHNVLILQGKGHDGKSMLIRLLQLCMPPGSYLAMSPQELSSGTGGGAEGRARLAGKYAVFCEDVSAETMRDSSHYKTATGYGRMSGRFFGSGVQSFDFVPRATWLLSCQELWKNLDKTKGFARRHTVIEMPNSIALRGAVRDLALRLYSLERQQIVSWACQAAVALLHGGHLAEPAGSAPVVARWAETGEGDEGGVLRFLRGCTRLLEPGADWTPLESLHASYAAWCDAEGVSARSYRRFARLLRDVDGTLIERSRVTRGEKRRTVNRAV